MHLLAEIRLFIYVLEPRITTFRAPCLVTDFHLALAALLPTPFDSHPER